VTESLLQIRNLGISYRARSGDPHQALSNVSLEIAPGRVLGLVGGSGSGKTTLGLAILRLLPSSAHIDTGAILFRGVDLLRAGERALQRIRGAQISIIFQEPALALNPVLRVGEQIADVITAHSDRSRQQCREIAKERMRQLQLPEVENLYDAYPHELSGGQRQRIAIAQAFACRPALVIADEPTTALDSVTQAEILGLIKQLVATTGVAMILITHDPALLYDLADRIAVLNGGTLVEEGPFREVCERPAHPYTGSLLAEARKC
jgi:ABC-type glutathione transport system ATPase component